MNGRRFVFVVVLTSLVAGAALAQQKPGPPLPGAEVKKLEPFAGKWKGEAEMKPGPWGPGGKMTSESECTWFDGGFQLICRESGAGAMGKMKSESILGWSPEERIYKYMGFDSLGMMGTATGTVSGNTWTWTGSDKMGGKTIHSKYTVTLNTPTTQSFKWETSEDGKTWTTAAEGKSTKQ
ncbi:MAG TPA: DUF1579 family protein [Myxococcota bacterium]|nr:DUF1579 family protein [Myxococcota bacterium]